MNFPTRAPICTLLGFVLALAFSFLICRAWLNRDATLAQRFYLRSYVRSFVPIPKVQTYSVLEPSGSLRLTIRARDMHVWLNAHVYDQGRALRLPLYASGACMIVALFVGAFLDGQRRRRLRAGVQIDGRRIVGIEEFGKRSGKEPFLIRVEE